MSYGIVRPAIRMAGQDDAEAMGPAFSETAKLYWALKRSAVKFRKARWLILGLRNQGWDWVECGRMLKDWARARAWVGVTAEPEPNWDQVDWASLAHQIVDPAGERA